MSSLPLIKVAGVPEHFNTPWTLAIEKGIFAKHGVEVEFIEQKLGTGALLSMIKQQPVEEVDVVVALTEGLVADIVGQQGAPSSSSPSSSDVRLLGTYVESPLCWAISVGKGSPINSIEDLRGKRFGISRYGSGSHLMAYVLAGQRGWDLKKDLSFVVKGSFANLREGVNDGSSDVFMWETFMTKPFHDSGEVKRVGEITTPWPCFMLASRVPIIDKKEDAIKRMIYGIREAADLFHSDPEAMPMRVADKFGHRLEDSKEWYKGVRIAGAGDLSESALEKTLSILRDVGVINESTHVTLQDIFDPRIAHVRRDIKYMRLYNKPELLKSTYNQLAHANLSKGPLNVDTLAKYDQHHYHGLEAVDYCIKALNINKNSRVLQLGSGMGGPSRYIASRTGCKVLAVELQHDLTATAFELTERCSLTHLVHHVAGDFLQIGEHLQPGSYDCIVSWLTVLHIVDREKLFNTCAHLLRPGGYFYAEDFYQKLTLNPAEKQILQDDVFCSYLPSWQRYNLDATNAGFKVEKMDELTADWTEYTSERAKQFEGNTALCAIIGKDTHQGLADFYNKIAVLFRGGNLGGVRVIAKKP